MLKYVHISMGAKMNKYKNLWKIKLYKNLTKNEQHNHQLVL